MTKKAEDQTTTEEDVTVTETGEEEQTSGEQETQSTEQTETTSTETTTEEETVVTIGEEPPPSTEGDDRAPEWVRELHKSHRELQRENRELKTQLRTVNTGEKTVVVGEKPTLEACAFDTEKFEKELTSWYDRKRQADEQEAQARAQQENEQKAWQSRLDAYNKGKTELKVKDFDDAEAVVQETLSTTQLGILVQGSDNATILVYALGKNPKKAKELASITDPVKFAFAVAKLETQLKVTNRKAPPPPEKTVQGSSGVSISGTVDSTLERLRAEAEKTGDFTKVVQYKRSKRQAA